MIEIHKAFNLQDLAMNQEICNFGGEINQSPISI